MKTFIAKILAVAAMLSALMIASSIEVQAKGVLHHHRYHAKTQQTKNSCHALPSIIPSDRKLREQLNAGCSEGPNGASLFGALEAWPKAMDPVTDPAILNNVPKGVTPVYVGVTGTITYRGPNGERLVAHNQPLFADRELVRALILANDMIAKAKNDPSARVHFVTEDPAIDRENALGRTLWQGSHAQGFTAGSRSVHVRTERAADISNWSDPDVRAALRAVGIIRSGDHSRYMDRLDPDHHVFDSSRVKQIDKMWMKRQKNRAGFIFP